MQEVDDDDESPNRIEYSVVLLYLVQNIHFISLVSYK